MTRRELDARILALIDGRGDLDDVARDVFAWQLERSPAYRALCERRGVRGVSGWRDVPAVPVSAFKDLDLRTFPAAESVATFRTSGTTTGTRGEHAFDDLTLYRRASMAAFASALVPEGQRIPIVSLICGVDAAPDSSLSQMVSWAVEELGSSGSRVDPSGAALEGLSEPVLVLGTAFGLADAFDSRPGLRLPEGTRIMETGGFKGRRREVTRAWLHERYARAGVGSEWVVGEYGMTELSSQWYDGVAGDAGLDPDQRVYSPPPWARTRVVDPVTLDDVDHGATGLLLHFDPVNRGSAQAILTGDLGQRRPGGFVYLGRAEGAGVRGCSQRDEAGARGRLR